MHSQSGNRLIPLLKAVSYTHLDVYKRQYVNSPWLIRITESDLVKAGGLQKEVLPELPPVSHLVENEINVDFTQDVDTVRLAVRRPNSVSYTHLDVYKRQVSLRL